MFLGKVNLRNDFKIFIISGLRAKTFRAFGKSFRQSYQTAFYSSRAKFWEKKLSEGCFNFVSFADIEHFFSVFVQKFSAFVKSAVCVSRRMFPKFFLCRKIFLLSLSDFEWEFFWLLAYFFSTRLPQVHSLFTEEEVYGFSRNFLIFFETLSGKIFVLAKLGSRVVKTAFFYVYRRALWRQIFGGVLFFHPSRIMVSFSLLLEKRLWNGFQRCSLPLQENVLGMFQFLNFFPSFWEFEWKRDWIFIKDFRQVCRSCILTFQTNTLR